MTLPEKKRKELENDAQFFEFLEIMGGRGTRKLWENDDAAASSAEMTAALSERAKKELGMAMDDEGSSDEDEYNENPIVGDDSSGEEEEEGEGESSSEEEEEVEMEDPSTKIANDKKLSDLDYLKQMSSNMSDDSDMSDSEEEEEKTRRRSEMAIDESDSEDESKYTTTKKSNKMEVEDESDEDGDEEERRKRKKKEKKEKKKREKEEREKESDKPVDDRPVMPAHVHHQPKPSLEEEVEAEIADTGRLFIRNLPYTIAEEELQELFEKYGEINELHIPKDATNRPKGFALVTFSSPIHAVRAFHELDSTIFQGRLMHIIAGRAKRKTAEEKMMDEMGDDDLDSVTFKKKKEMQRQREAAQNKDSWNSLFINADTVAASIAAKYNVDKADILGMEADNTAVRLALAETQLISETKAFLEDNGVSVEAFSGPKSTTKRSNCVILVKNIPYNTEEDEVRRMFAKFGTLGRVVLPPSKTMALVEYIEPNEAKKGFRGCAYKKFKHAPLYLEWAPMGTFREKATTPGAVKGQSVTDGLLEEQVDEEEVEGGTVFVKNLNFDTVEETLTRTFSQIGAVKSVTIPMKKNTKYGVSGRDKHKELLSMGYGFVEYKLKADAVKALKSLQNTEIDGHQVILKLSTRTDAPKTTKKKKTNKSDEEGLATVDDKDASTKIAVKNVPFEASKREIRDLFSTYGQVKKVRLPKKFDGSRRGFAFIDFLTKQEAKNAFKYVYSCCLVVVGVVVVGGGGGSGGGV